MRAIAWLLLGAVVLGPQRAEAACADLARDWFGFAIGPMGAYPEGLTPEMRRVGAARVIEGVGLEQLQGRAAGIDFDNVMVFVDRGSFVGFVALGAKGGEADSGLASIRRLVAARGEADAGGGAVACEPGFVLAVEPAKGESGAPRVKVSLINLVAQSAMQRYIEAYCADPRRVRPGDACKR